MTELVPTAAAPAPATPTLDWADMAEARMLDGAVALARQGARWDDHLLRRAAKLAGLSPADAALLLPQGPRDLAALLWRRHDRAAMAALGALDPATLKIRGRIRAGVLARTEAAMADRAAVEAASRFLLRPGEAALGLRLGWETADRIWRWAGDTATDANHYSKRALLWGVMASTFAARLARGPEAAERMLDARLADVMKFEGLKARVPPVMDGLTVLAAQLGRLRYQGLGSKA
jgi:ubiquinone biosynthesis protein COQ9